MERGNLLVLFLVVIGYLIIFFYYPLIIILREAFYYRGHLTLNNFIRIITKQTIIDSITFTIVESIASTILSILLGMPIAYILTKYEFRGKSLFSAFSIVPFILPGIVVGFSFLILWGPDGLVPGLINKIFNLNWGISEWGFISIILAHAFYNSPLIGAMTSSVWRRIDPEIEEMAEILGCHGLSKFRKVTLPMIYPGLLSASLLTFIFSFTSFEVVLLLGSFKYRTVEVEIYTLFRTKLDFEGAAALSIYQLMIVMILTYMYIKSLEKYSEVRKRGRSAVLLVKKLRISPLNKESVTIISYLIFYTLFLSIPIGLVIFYSFFDPVLDVFTLKGYTGLLSTVTNPYLGSAPVYAPLNTVFFSTINAIIAVMLGLISAYAIRDRSSVSIVTSVATFLPLATSRITIGLGMILAFGSIGILYNDTRPLIISSYIIMAYPFATRSVLNGLSKLDPSLIESAEILGMHSYKRFLRVDLPIIAPSITVGAVLAFATGLGEFAATNILYKGNYPTLTVLLYLMLAGRRFVVASAAASVLIFTSFLVFLILIKSGEEIGSGF